MRVVIVAVGRLKRGPEYELVSDYLARSRVLGRRLGFPEMSVLEVEAPNGLTGTQRQLREGVLLVDSIPAGASAIALDECGDTLDSVAFAGLLARMRDRGEPAVAFLIGGADGLSEEARARGDMAVSFGRATFPHLLVRAMLAEQIYRAMTILSGHPYHRA